MIICDPLDYYFESYFQFDTHIIPPSIPSTIPLNNTKTIQIPSSLVDSSLVSYAVIFILHGLKSFLSLSGWLSMSIVIFGYFLNTYGSYLMPVHHSYSYTHQFSLVAHNFPSLALYHHGAIEDFVLSIPYANIYDISKLYQHHIRSTKVLHHIEKLTCDPHHNFTSIKGMV